MPTAVEMADESGIAPKKFRDALLRAALKWHGKGERWTVGVGSNEHEDMKRVLRSLTGYREP
jgi:hypothetical protein